jgi:hypothetical protein
MLKNKWIFFTFCFLPNAGTTYQYHTSLVGTTINDAKTIFPVKSLWSGLVVDTRYNLGLYEIEI